MVLLGVGHPLSYNGYDCVERVGCLVQANGEQKSTTYYLCGLPQDHSHMISLGKSGGLGMSILIVF